MVKLYIHSSFNNTHAAIYKDGKMLYKASSGMSQIRGSFKKNSSIALLSIGAHLIDFLKMHVKEKPVVIFFSGIGKGKFFIVKAFSTYPVLNCYYSPSMAFNGCRRKKERRLLYSFWANV